MALSGTDPNVVNSDDGTVPSLAQAFALMQRQYAEILTRINVLSERLTELTARESELRIILQRNTEFEPQIERLNLQLRKKSTQERVIAAIDGAELHPEPFPHTVIDRVLPGNLYDSLLRGLPPVEVFPDRADCKQQLAVPSSLAPNYSQRVEPFCRRGNSWSHRTSPDREIPHAD